MSVFKLRLSGVAGDDDGKIQSLNEKWQAQGKKLVALSSEKQHTEDQLKQLNERADSLNEAKKQLKKEEEEQKKQSEQLAALLNEVEASLKQAADQVRALAEERSQLEEEEKKWKNATPSDLWKRKILTKL
ncbi:MAG: hypothetical protein LOD92_07855 [Bacillales bacterium]